MSLLHLHVLARKMIIFYVFIVPGASAFSKRAYTAHPSVGLLLYFNAETFFANVVIRCGVVLKVIWQMVLLKMCAQASCHFTCLKLFRPGVLN